MELKLETLENGIRVIRLAGELDIKGTGAVETRVSAYCAVDGVRVMMDLSGVTFIASIGIRLLMLTAKSVSNRGGRTGLLVPRGSVRQTLELTGIDNVIPIFDNFETAQAELLA